MTGNFRTEIKLKEGAFPEINYSSRLFLIGSCFSDEIGKRFIQNKFPVLSNPLGICYNPISIVSHIERLISKTYFSKADLISKGELYNSYELHGSFDGLNVDQLLADINQVIENGHAFLKEASHIYITLGTAWVYSLSESNMIVNNCHKKPASLFTKKLLSIGEIKQALLGIQQQLRKFNPSAELIFTVSPVRHLKDGFSNNSLSKSILRLAINDLLNNETHYFPSYEILMDDLRDYRFYSDDMLHPNNQAVEYIWNCLVKTQMSRETIALLNSINHIMTQFSHRLLNKDSIAAKKFTETLLNEFTKMQTEHTQLDFRKELTDIKSRLLTAK